MSDISQPRPVGESDRLRARIEALEAMLRKISRWPRGEKSEHPNGVHNLRAIMADQLYRNSALSIHEIEAILDNKAGFMPDEAVAWFREARGRTPSAQGRCR
jgi:hypothetical protein